MKYYETKSVISGQQLIAMPAPQNALRLAMLFQLERTQWLSPAELKEAQLKQFKIILKHAQASVPFYRERYAQAGINIPETLTEDFFVQLPIIRRQDIQEAGDQFVTKKLPQEHGTIQFATTSGSTGRPVRFGRTALTNISWLVFALREHLWHERNFTGKLCAIRWAKLGVASAPDGLSSANWGEVIDPIFPSGPSSLLNVTAKLSEQLDWLHREKPDYLISFPSNLLALSQYAEQTGSKLPRVQHLRVVGETLTAEMRKALEDSWSTSVIDMYTCEEAGYLATQCPQSEHFHVQSENVILEIVDDEGRPCPVGVSGRVLITSLNNFATPLIRYELGDYAEFGPPCVCGRGLPVIKRILGRKRNRLIMADGESRYSLFPYLGEHGQIASVTGVKVKQFQCVQHTVQRIEIKLVTERELTLEEQARVTQLMQGHLGYAFEIFYTFLEDIPRGPNGKFEEFISLVDA
jgi:phenylacetate-CoA ligase